MRPRKEVNALVRSGVPYEKISVIRHEMVREGTLTYGGKTVLNNPKESAMLANQLFRNADREMLLVVSFTSTMQPITIEIAAVGTVRKCIVDVPEVFKTAIINSAAGIMIFHNHPSGNCKPSIDDMKLTKRMKEAGKLLGIPLYDHIICATDGSFFSFCDEGLLSDKLGESGY